MGVPSAADICTCCAHTGRQPQRGQVSATPSARAAFITASATIRASPGVNGSGTIRSALARPGTAAQIAPEAATFMPSVIRRAPQSSAPRKIPGKASTLLIWLA